MARIKIKDLPKDLKISKEELKKIKAGFTSSQNLGLGQSFSVSTYKSEPQETDLFAPPYVPV